jgi:hypothetical protein
MQLPIQETTFTFSEVSEETGLKYEGDFTVKTRLSIKEKMDLQKTKLRLIGDTSLVNDSYAALENMAQVVATFRARILKAPTWFNQSDYGQNLEDTNIFYKLYKAVEDSEKQWNEKLKKMADSSKETADVLPNDQ